jgi:hypothetical protein
MIPCPEGGVHTAHTNTGKRTLNGTLRQILAEKWQFRIVFACQWNELRLVLVHVLVIEEGKPPVRPSFPHILKMRKKWTGMAYGLGDW